MIRLSLTVVLLSTCCHQGLAEIIRVRMETNGAENGESWTNAVPG